MAWRESTLSYRKALKNARSDYFLSLLEEINITPGIYSIQWQNLQKIKHHLVLTFPNSTAVMTL